jgi:hypothetical protein
MITSTQSITRSRSKSIDVGGGKSVKEVKEAKEAKEMAKEPAKEPLTKAKSAKSATMASSPRDMLMQSLIHFFQKKDHIDELLPIIEGTSKISLRILDWFVTNFSKKYNTTYLLDKKTINGPKNFAVYVAYKAQLKGYQKKQFDPFCRRERIKFIVHGGKEIITTVGQLNFFRWAIDNNVLKYIGEHFEEIEKDMNDSLKNMYKKKEEEEQNKRRKRRQLSVSAIKTVNKHNTSIIVSFN